MRRFVKIVFPIWLIGSVDLIEDDYAHVEIIEYADGEYGVVYRTMPVEVFPCEVEEGSMFYFSYVDNVTEIRCGQPPE